MNKFATLKSFIFKEFSSNGKVNLLTKQLSRAAQNILEEAWVEAGLSDFPMPVSPCLVAVGGFGRDELFPYSDVDILVLLNFGIDQPEFNLYKDKFEKFITLCWDYGLEIGSSVRTVDECIEESNKDITIRTALLESRFLCGNRKLYQSFAARYDAEMDPKSFFLEKLLELRQRHQKYQNTPYSLEPNCKESPGGLRDIQAILWMTRAAGFGSTINDLSIRGILTPRETRELNKNYKLLQTIRAHLHLISNRRQDQLIFEAQTPLAACFGLETTSAKRASEQIMRRYYWAAKAVNQLNEILIQNIKALIFPREASHSLPISEHFVEKNNQLDIIDPLFFERRPECIFLAFFTFSQHSSLDGFSSQALRSLYNSRELMDKKWREDPQNRAQFIEIIKQPRGITRTLQLMNQTSVLGRYLPPFRKIVGQMQHDLFHVYTVDQHILTVLKNVRRFFVPELAHEFPFCSQLAANFDKPWLLVLGALFHDIAKGRGGDHSDLGKKDVRIFAKQHQLTPEETELVSFLVAEHLSMSQIAQKQDISDPEVVQAFANKVKDEKHLTALYLLTVADIRGTSPKVWNAWKAKLLEDLYRITLKFLGGAKYDTHSQLEQCQQKAQEILRLHGLRSDSHVEFWQQIDIGFFLKHDPDDIAWVTRHLFNQVNSNKSIVCARISPIGEGLQVFVYTPDQVDLFARICSYFDKSKFNILDANIQTTKHHYALDTFQISYLDGSEIAAYRDLIQMIEHDLTEIITRNLALPEAFKGRISRQSRTFPVQPLVSLVPDERGDSFILSLSASDRVGLLYGISKVLAKHQISLKSARINTLGERVEDTLLLDGERLKLNPKLQIQLETELFEVLGV